MKQWDAINVVVGALKDDSAVRALFLKGSLAKDVGDEYSDVNLYCLVHDDQLEDFFVKRIMYLEQYKTILFWSESNFVGPQIVAIFEDGLHFDLYTVTEKRLPKTYSIKIIYDPEKLLSQYQSMPLSLTSEDVIQLINEFFFVFYEYQFAYKRKDFSWASRLASHLSGEFAILLRSVIEPSTGMLGFIKMEAKLGNC